MSDEKSKEIRAIKKRMWKKLWNNVIRTIKAEFVFQKEVLRYHTFQLFCNYIAPIVCKTNSITLAKYSMKILRKIDNESVDDIINNARDKFIN